MRQYESVKLKNEVNDLQEKGIDVNTLGVLIYQIASSGQWIVMFLNPKNVGDYAVATVSERDLIRLGSLPAAAISEVKEIANRPNFFERTSFLPVRFKEYDMVELTVDKPKYKKEGVKKGMRGCVMSEYAIKGQWQIIFSEEGTGKDVADIMVLEEDFILVQEYIK